MREALRITDAEELMHSIAGLRVKDGHETADGLHINLEDGRCLIFAGQFVIAVYKTEQVH